VAFVPDVATTFAAPLASDPNCSAMRRTTICATDPDVAMTIPTVVARNPVVAGTGGGNDLDGARRGRTDTNDDLSVGCKRGSHSESKGCGGDK
jgi:hypothetical protein